MVYSPFFLWVLVLLYSMGGISSSSSPLATDLRWWRKRIHLAQRRIFATRRSMMRSVASIKALICCLYRRRQSVVVIRDDVVRGGCCFWPVSLTLFFWGLKDTLQKWDSRKILDIKWYLNEKVHPISRQHGKNWQFGIGNPHFHRWPHLCTQPGWQQVRQPELGPEYYVAFELRY